MLNMLSLLFGGCFPPISEIDESELQQLITKYESTITKKYQAFYDILLVIDQMGYFTNNLSISPSEMLKKLKNYRTIILTEKDTDIAKYHKYFGNTPKSIKMEMIIYTGCFNDMTLGQTDENGQSFVHHAVKCRQLNILKYLLQNGENVNLQDKVGKTPLFYTCSKRHEDGQTTKILFAHGANPEIKDCSDTSWIDYAMTKRNFNNINSLIVSTERNEN